ncbi:tolloid-like protein 2 [Amphiura filiformis]|uniref:tolloid-like protein 2 n=1 Tax=Amphiura filiformis TaxID=82378 RepID=UPI003B215E93
MRRFATQEMPFMAEVYLIKSRKLGSAASISDSFPEHCPNEETQLSLNTSFTIHSPGYPAYYQNNMQCAWKVIPTPMRKVLVQFMDIKLENGDDVLYIGTINTSRALAYSGYRTLGPRIISPTNESLLFEFTTGSSRTDHGFSLLVTDVENGDYILCPNGLEIIQESFACTGCPNETTQMSINASVTIQSSGYPSYYLSNIRCEWRVIPSATRKVLLQFLDFKLEKMYDLLYIGTINHPRDFVYSGYGTSDARIISPINDSLLFEFTTDNSGTDQGFSLLVTDVANEGKRHMGY